MKVIVLGGGITGLSTAFELKRAGVECTLLEQFVPGHSQGSSHGKSRITRSTYSTPKYVEMMQWVHQVGWREWQELSSLSLLWPRPGLFFGPGLAAYQESLASVPGVQSFIETLPAAEARRRFAPFQFPDSPQVLVDSSCALVAAERTLTWLRSQIEVRSQVRVLGWQRGDRLRLETSQGPIECDRLIVAAGPWTHQLLGGLAPVIRPAHQDVGYFAVEGAHQFPVWVYSGAEADESFYGLPEFERPGVKLARHRTGPHGDDPARSLPESLPYEALEDLLEFAARQWGQRPALVGYDPCIYSNTPNEDFILDHWPEDERVVVGAGFSGHGFKFAPLLGRVLSQLCLHGHTQIEAFERHRQAFRWSTAQPWNG
jgi:monomeric sarcosine oxidase